MVRVNIILLFAAVLCALSVVTSQHKARKLFQAMEGEQERARQLDIEYDQLQLELSTWATSPRIDKIARENLKMRPAGSPVGRPAGSAPGAHAVVSVAAAHTAAAIPASRPAASKPMPAKAGGVAR